MMTKQQVAEAVAQGWCDPKTSHKEMDVDLAIAIADAVYAAQAQAAVEPVAYWIPKAEQFCFASPTGRPFAKAWEPLYTSPPDHTAEIARLRGLLRGAERIIGEGDKTVDARSWLKAFDQELSK